MTDKPWITGGNPPRATGGDFDRAARQLGCTPAEIKAVWKVEAAGRPFRRDGSVERRFEPHHFPRTRWGQIGFSVREGEAPWRASLRLSNEAMFVRAYENNGNAALRAASWGAPQIMGFNHSDAGFIEARDMVAAMATGEAKHLEAFTTLINKWGLAPAIRAHDWERFARRYNGPGQVKHYAGLLERAFGVTSTQKHAAALEKASREETGAASRVVLRRGSEGADVAKLQRALQIADDGVFGEITEKTVKQFQARNGLIVDGIVGQRTWRLLEAEALIAEKISDQPASVAAAKSSEAAVGAAGAGIAALAAVNPLIALGAAAVVVGGILWYRSRR